MAPPDAGCLIWSAQLAHFASVLSGAEIGTPAIKGQMTMTKMRTKMIQND